MMDQLTIVVVVTAYNRPRIVLEALQSVVDQSRRPDRLIVVDDGSTNETPDNIQAWIDEHDPPFEARLVRQENGGLASARNRGAEEAEPFDVIAYLDDDDLWPTDYLQRVAETMSGHPDAVAASADRLDIDDAHGGRQRLRQFDEIGDRTTQHLFIDGPPGSTNTVFRGEAFRAIGGYDSTLRNAEDYQLMLRLSLRGPWVHMPGDPIRIRRGSATGEQVPQLSKRYAHRRYILAKVLDQFIQEEGGAEVIPESLWRRRLGRVWYSAGRQLHALGRHDEAAECFRLAAERNPRHLRARLRRLAHSLPG